MRFAFIIIVIIHGLIHLLGFVKGFGLKEVKELSLPISKTMGLLWLVASMINLLFGYLFIVGNKYAWLLGLIAVVLSQILVIIFWKDAKYATIANVIILVVSAMAFGRYNFQKQIQEETNRILEDIKIPTGNVVSEKDIDDLPEPVKNWLRHSGMIGKPFIKVGKVTQQAEMKMKPEQKNWMPAIATQYTTIDKPAFIWTVDLKMNQVMKIKGRDKFENGQGEMLIKLNSLFNIVNEEGEKLNEGTIQRYLGELVWFPSLALSPYITWEQVSDTSAKATMTYLGTTGSGTFYFNSDGDFTQYSAMRYRGNEEHAKRSEWVLQVNDYKTFEGIKVPEKMMATWKLEEGDWTWLKLEITDLKFNVNAL